MSVVDSSPETEERPDESRARMSSFSRRAVLWSKKRRVSTLPSSRRRETARTLGAITELEREVGLVDGIDELEADARLGYRLGLIAQLLLLDLLLLVLLDLSDSVVRLSRTLLQRARFDACDPDLDRAENVETARIGASLVGVVGETELGKYEWLVGGL